MPGMDPQADGSVLVDGGIPVNALNSAMGWDLPARRALTVAGLVIREVGAIPDIGQIFAFFGYRFEIRWKVANRITRLKITPPDFGAADIRSDCRKFID